MSAPTVVILAAGQGTRMRSATPKVLHDLCGRPMIAWPVAAAREAGAGRIVVVASPGGGLEGHLPEGVELAIQPVANGTGGAVIAAAEHIERDTPVIVVNGDVPVITADVLADLAQAHAASGAPATMATAVLDDPSGYGRVVRGADGAVERVVETKTPGDATPEELEIHEVNTGIYAFDGGALLDALPRVTTDNVQGEIYLPDVLKIMRGDGAAVAAHVVQDPSIVLGVNDRVDLAAIRAILQRRIHEAHMRAGVTIVAPESTLIDAGVVIGRDTIVEPFTCLRGATRIGERCSIGSFTTTFDATLGDGVRVVRSHLVECEVHDGALIGPFAYLRPKTVLRENAKAGTFVEIKNSDIGAGAKVPHLSYIGDADVGERANLGAGTITANYDGRTKHRTTIGARFRGGVDTSFVAPVTVGDDSFTAAGSVITQDVPAGGLGVARARQRNVEGYAERASGAADPAPPGPAR
jgi:bifunctional UDP-N-acetylglucosamine pyrophosphorylase/glucosamine-1-phosphate N-acetyltransferase